MMFSRVTRQGRIAAAAALLLVLPANAIAQEYTESHLAAARDTIEAMAVLLRGWSASLPIRDDLVRSSDRDLEAQARAMAALGYSEDGVGDMDAGQDGEPDREEDDE